MKTSRKTAQARFLEVYGAARERIVNLADELQSELDAIEGLQASALQMIAYVSAIELCLRYGGEMGERAVLEAVLLGRVAAEAGDDRAEGARPVASAGCLVN